ncbi:MAG: TSUP family transporter [Gammaproteobacteria bacterium]
MEFHVADLIASICAITLGAILQASTGLGAGLIITPLLGLISMELIPGPVICGGLVLSSIMAYRGRIDINFTNMKTLIAGLVAGATLGALSIAAIPLTRSGVLFGVLVLLAVAVTGAGVRIPFSRFNLIAAGMLSGFHGNTAAIGGPVLALLYQHETGKTLRAPRLRSSTVYHQY